MFLICNWNQIFEKVFLLLKLSGGNIGITMGWDITEGLGGLYTIYSPPPGFAPENYSWPKFLPGGYSISYSASWPPDSVSFLSTCTSD